MRVARLAGVDGSDLAIGVDDHVVSLEACGEIGARLARQCRTALDVLSLPVEVGRQLEREARAVLADHGRLDDLSRSRRGGRVDVVDLAAPVAQPSKIICLALNYRAHAEEGGFVPPDRPVLFLKGPHTLTGHRAIVAAPPITQRVDHEGELAVVIGRRARHVPRNRWREYVAGYSVMNDLTARDLQLEDLSASHPWDLAKNLEGFAPMGPWLVSADEIDDPNALAFTVRVDGEVRQQGNTSAMIFDIPTLIESLSALMTLEAGDIIATGTCDGIGEIPDGSECAVTFEGLGTLRNRVVLSH
jgi:2-keto-4-pentenoate hydratase/2-oxohepta-3-ene-1,7-dioic acid hydratase in catechol pathway